MDQILEEESEIFLQEDSFDQEKQYDNGIAMDEQTLQIYLNNLNSTIYNIINLKEVIYQSKQISKLGLHKAIKLIEQSIYYLNKIQTSFKYDPGLDNQINIIKSCSMIRSKLNQWLKNEITNNKNNIDQIQELINKISENNLNNKKYTKFERKYVISTINKEGTRFAFNKNATIMFVDDQIYGFNSNHKLIKILGQHQSIVQLIWMKNSESLLTRSEKSMIIWNNQWQPQFILEEQALQICSMIVDDEEDLIISGSYNIIKFWGKKNLSWNCHQSIITKISNTSLSLNSNKKKLISCGREFEEKIQIIIMELQDDQQWIIAQRLEPMNQGNGKFLYFINNTQFIFNPQSQGYLSIFNYEQETNKFLLNNLLLIPCHQSTKDLLSFCHFIKQKKVLIVNYDSEIYFFSFNENGEHEQYQSIKLGNYRILQSSTDDGQFLVISKWERTYSIEIIKIRQRS